MKKAGGSCPVTAVPDQPMDATAQARRECFNIDPASVDNHPRRCPVRACSRNLAGEPNATVSWSFLYR